MLFRWTYILRLASRPEKAAREPLSPGDDKAAIAEFGTGPRYHKKTRKFVGAMPAQPFLRPAWEQHKDQILEDFSKALWIQIEKSAKRLARRQAKAAGIKP